MSTLEAVTAALQLPGEPSSHDSDPVQPGGDDPVEEPDRGQPGGAPIGDGSSVAVVTDREQGADQVARASVAAVTAAALRQPDTVAGGPSTDPDRGSGDVQLALGEAADLARRARPVPAADQD